MSDRMLMIVSYPVLGAIFIGARFVLFIRCGDDRVADGDQPPSPEPAQAIQSSVLREERETFA
jgi:hypothetical protein